MPQFLLLMLISPFYLLLPNLGWLSQPYSDRDFNREEKSLRHVAMIAKFWGDIKPIKPVYSHYFKLHQSYSISFNLANLGEIFFETLSIVI